MNGGLSEAEIEEMVRRFPLPAGVPDATLNRSELAEFFAVSALTITSWMGQGMPVQHEGDQGRPYEFRAAACWAWRQARSAADEARSAEARAAISSMRLELIGGGTGDSIEALDPKTRREIYAAQAEYERWCAQRKQLMPRADVADLIEQIFLIFSHGLETAPDRVERVQAMPPKAVDAFIHVCDDIQAEMRRRICNFWNINPESTTPERRDLFDAPAV